MYPVDCVMTWSSLELFYCSISAERVGLGEENSN